MATVTQLITSLHGKKVQAFVDYDDATLEMLAIRIINNGSTTTKMILTDSSYQPIDQTSSSPSLSSSKVLAPTTGTMIKDKDGELTTSCLIVVGDL